MANNKQTKNPKLPEAAARSVAKRIAQVFTFIISFIIVISLTLFGMLKLICSYESSKSTFVTTVLESGSLKFLASLCVSKDEIQKIVNSTSLEELVDSTVNEEMITIPSQDETTENNGSSDDERDIEIIDIAGLTYKATLMIVKDPSRVSVTTTAYGPDSWPPEGGVPLKTLIDRAGAVGGINGGIFDASNYNGDHAYGILVSDGVILRNKPRELPGLVLVGLTENNILQIIDVKNMSAADSLKMIKEKGIRDAVCFQDNTSADNNHFVQLIINGVQREINGAGSGLNPRTAIGQRADGAILLLVTDGRGYNNHVGASAADLIEIMSRYGAVNAANLDGGSSTCMYYNGEYLQNCVTFYYSKSSWQLPDAFIVK